ncbi:MAG: hypothetical protein H7A25_24325 [Leptospiraceae bacterium]|nr:hypothetical protein [Leptospiraceae bacterium]MCP5503047.1 hypothetical protein [Leptospiraceae bacterium]
MDWIRENIAIINSLQGKHKRDEEEIQDMIDLVIETYNVEIRELQEAYIKNLIYIEPFLYTGGDEEEWPYHAKLIREGKFPLNRIPLHLRALTERLYYK